MDYLQILLLGFADKTYDAVTVECLEMFHLNIGIVQQFIKRRNLQSADYKLVHKITSFALTKCCMLFITQQLNGWNHSSTLNRF